MMVTRVRRRRVAEAHLRRCPVRARGQTAAAHPDRQEKLRALTGCRHAAGHDVAQRCPLGFNVQLDTGRLVDEALVATETLVARSKRLAREHGVEMHVEGSRFGTFGNVESQVGVARDVHRARDEGQHGAPRHAGVGVAQGRSIDAGGRKEGSRIMTQHLQARHEWSNGPDRQVRFECGHAASIIPGTSGSRSHLPPRTLAIDIMAS